MVFKKFKPSPLDHFLSSEYWLAWDEENRSPGSCGIILTDLDRYTRIEEAASHGAEGSTHAEVMDDWIAAVNDGVVCGAFTEEAGDAILNDIEQCIKWHEEDHSLHNEIG